MKDITPEKALEMIKGFTQRIGMGSFGQNFVKQGEDFYISFNPHTDQGAETALVKENGEGKRRDFYILLGNHTDDFDETLSFEENKAVYDQLIKDGAEESPWSE